LPSIPHDDDFEILKQLRSQNNITYTCKNGHYYIIASCQKPVEIGTCPTCKTKIGGIKYQLSEGNRKISDSNNEKVEHGYCVHEASERTLQPESIRNMGVLNTIIVRLILDCSLYLSSLHSDRDVRSILMTDNNVDDVSKFFAEQVATDVKILSHCLQHSPDESLLLIHYMLSKVKLVKGNNNKKEANKGGEMSSKEARNQFEETFCRQFITDVIGSDSGNIIQELTKILADDAKNSGSNELFKIAYDLIEPVADQVQSNNHPLKILDNRKFW